MTADCKRKKKGNAFSYLIYAENKSLTNPRSFSVQDGSDLLLILRQGPVMSLPKSQLARRSHCDPRLHIRRLIILYIPERQNDERLDARKIDCPMRYHTVDNGICVII